MITVTTGNAADHLRRSIVVMVGSIALLSPAAAPAQPPASPVGVDEVRIEPIAQTTPVLGRLVAVQSGIVAARAGGPVAALKVDVGDRVAAGDLLAELDQDRLATELALQTAELEALQAARDTALARESYANKELARIGKLKKSAAFSQFEFDSRQQELELARAARREAEARIAQGQVKKQLADIELRDGAIVAPYPGVVTLLHTSAGAWLRRGDPVVTLINHTDLEIEADVPAQRLSALQPGVRLDARLDDGTAFKTTVRSVIPDENPSARTRPVRLALDTSAASALDRLAVNQAVTLAIPVSAATEALSVAKDAVVRRGREAMVFVVEDGKAQPRPVTLGQALGGRFQVEGGLQPGDLVVVRGNERLRPGQPVQFRPPAPRGQDTVENDPS